MRILLSAFVCDPNQGSEEGVGWAWAYNLARAGHAVCVLTREAHRTVIENRLRELDLPNLRFEYVNVDVIPFWMPVFGCYPHYVVWQWSAYLRARRLHKENRFDITHHVTYAVFRNPSYLYLLNAPFIFGPVGGGESSPYALRMSMSRKAWAFEAVRDFINLLPHIDPFWRSMLRRCARIVVKTEETRACLSRGSISRSVITLENMLSGPPHLAGEMDCIPPLKLLFAGRLLQWKGVHLAVRAIASLRDQVPVTLTIVGKGSDETRLKDQVRCLNLEQTITFIPWMPKAEFLCMYAKHDALVFPSLHDSGGTVVMEALAHGKPVIYLDLGGPANTVDEHCARVVNTKGRTEEQVVQEIANAIRDFAQMPAQEWREMRRRAVCRAQFYAPDLVIERVYGPLLIPNGRQI